MSDGFYDVVVGLGSGVGRLVSRPTVRHAERVPRRGGFVLATNHHSPLDVAVLMYLTPRRLDFLSTERVMGTPVVGAFYRRFNAVALSRKGRGSDAAAMRRVVGRVRAGRAVAMFPEGRINAPETSVTAGGGHRPGLGRLARLAGVPVVPAVVLGADALTRPAAWLPLRRTRFAVAYGEPLTIDADAEPRAAQRDLEARWRREMVALRAELDASGWR
ncbi:MAG: lysophospholipid acyltransferase family protein [Planctomycetota bacterium]